MSTKHSTANRSIARTPSDRGNRRRKRREAARKQRAEFIASLPRLPKMDPKDYPMGRDGKPKYKAHREALAS